MMLRRFYRLPLIIGVLIFQSNPIQDRGQKSDTKQMNNLVYHLWCTPDMGIIV
jgi:hypothetical protein